MSKDKKNKNSLSTLIQHKKKLTKELCCLKKRQKSYNKTHINTKVHEHQIKYYLIHENRITSYDVTAEICPKISARTARRLLHKLYSNKEIQRHKHGKIIYYTSNSNKGE